MDKKQQSALRLLKENRYEHSDLKLKLKIIIRIYWAPLLFIKGKIGRFFSERPIFPRARMLAEELWGVAAPNHLC